MSNYFKNFPKTLYKFGNNEDAVTFQKLSKYVDLIDTVRDDNGTYIEYEIKDFERPDTLSQRLYGKSNYDWTFFLMNERLRETGWPMPLQQLYEVVQTKTFPHYIVKMNTGVGTSDLERAEYVSLFADKYPVGQEVIIGNAAGTVVSKNLSVGEITVSCDVDVTSTLYLSYPDNTNIVSVSSTVYQYEGTHHYTDSTGNEVDLYFDTIPGAKLPVSNLEYFIAQNDESKRIRVLKTQFADKVVGEFLRLTER
jgi:hypothetical protein|tara:strand:+ start:1264 stop:2019 length:756 start_codon:yes stop_codon:yes gene_type:complete